MICNGICSICPNPCYRGEIPRSKLQDFSEPVPLSKKELKGAEKAFDAPIQTGLTVVETPLQYEVTKTIFGKEKVRRVK